MVNGGQKEKLGTGIYILLRYCIGRTENITVTLLKLACY